MLRLRQTCKRKTQECQKQSSYDMQIKIHFCTVVTYKQKHKIHYDCIDYEKGSAAFDLSNGTDGESVSDYPLLRDWSYCRGRSLRSTVTVAVAKCQPFLPLHASKQTTEHLEVLAYKQTACGVRYTLCLLEG